MTQSEPSGKSASIRTAQRERTGTTVLSCLLANCMQHVHGDHIFACARTWCSTSALWKTARKTSMRNRWRTCWRARSPHPARKQPMAAAPCLPKKRPPRLKEAKAPRKQRRARKARRNPRRKTTRPREKARRSRRNIF